MDNYFDLLVVLLEAALLSFFLTCFVVQSYMIKGSSMEPTLKDGMRIFGNKIALRFRKPKRKEIVILKQDSQKLMIKRVIGLEGDVIYIKGGYLYLNGEILDEPYLAENIIADWGPYVVPEKSLFVLGDNRNASSDSRFFKEPLRLDEIKAIAVLAYWPLNTIKRL